MKIYKAMKRSGVHSGSVAEDYLSCCWQSDIQISADVFQWSALSLWHWLLPYEYSYARPG